LRKDSYFIIEVAGVGYKVYATAGNLRQTAEGDKIMLYTYLAVSEKALDLYGFLDPADKTFFTLLLEVPGIGPKSAIATLEKTTMKEVQDAILNDDPNMLVKMSGLGQKTAEKIILALKDKVQSLTARPKGEKGEAAGNSDLDAFDALVGFGYTAAEAKNALAAVDKNITDAGQRVREALKILGKKK
jgi:Holliday junction DNA helicase RuvA